MKNINQFVFLFSLVATAFAYPQFPLPITFSDQVGPQPCPSCSLRQAVSADDVQFSNAPFGYPYQRGVRSAVEVASLPTLEDLQPSLKDQSVYQMQHSNPSAMRSIRSPVDSIAPLFGVQYQPQFNRRARSQPPTMPELMQTEITPETMESIMRAAREAGLLQQQPTLPEGESLMKKASSPEDRKHEHKQETPEGANQSYGMYYMRVQAFNTFDTPNDISKVSKKEETLLDDTPIKADDLTAKHQPPKQDVPPQVDIVEALQELSMGQLAVLMQQEQMQEWTKGVYVQQEACWKEIQRQLELLTKATQSANKTPAVAASSMETVSEAVTSTTSQPCGSSTERPTFII